MSLRFESRLRGLVSAIGLTLFGLVFLSISEIIYFASDPARQTTEVLVKERIPLTKARRAERALLLGRGSHHHRRGFHDRGQGPGVVQDQRGMN
jgi:hypothetical protein